MEHSNNWKYGRGDNRTWGCKHCGAKGNWWKHTHCFQCGQGWWHAESTHSSGKGFGSGTAKDGILPKWMTQDSNTAMWTPQEQNVETQHPEVKEVDGDESEKSDPDKTTGISPEQYEMAVSLMEAFAADPNFSQLASTMKTVLKAHQPKMTRAESLNRLRSLEDRLKDKDKKVEQAQQVITDLNKQLAIATKALGELTQEIAEMKAEEFQLRSYVVNTCGPKEPPKKTPQETHSGNPSPSRENIPAEGEREAKQRRTDESSASTPISAPTPMET